MKIELEKKVEKLRQENEGFANRTCLIVAQNKKGKLVPLIIELITDDNINILSFNKSGYKEIGNIKLAALINNNIIKSVGGTNEVAIRLSKLIENKLSVEQKEEAVVGLRGMDEKELSGTVKEIITEKLRQLSEDKKNNILEDNKKSLENNFMIIYEKPDNSRLYLHATKKDDKVFLYNPLIKDFKKVELSVEALINDERVIGVYGNNKLAKKIKELTNGMRVKAIEENIEMQDDNNEIKGILFNMQKNNKEEDIFIEMPNNNNNNNNEVKGLLNMKNKKSGMKINK